MHLCTARLYRIITHPHHDLFCSTAEEQACAELLLELGDQVVLKLRMSAKTLPQTACHSPFVSAVGIIPTEG